MNSAHPWPFIAFAGDEPEIPTSQHEADEMQVNEAEPHLVVGAIRLSHIQPKEKA